MRILGGRGLATASAGLFLLLFPLTGAAPGAEPPLTLRILWDRPLPEAAASAHDLRWAGDESVLLALGWDGVVEMSLAPYGERIQQVVAGKKERGGFYVSTLLGAHSETVLVGAPIAAVTWQGRASKERREASFDAIQDLDLHAGRAVVLGDRRDAEGQFAPEGGIVWLGTLAADLDDARPVVFDTRGPGAPNLDACGSFRMGSVRFLPDGSFVVVPGVQAGALHFDPAGKLLRTWDTVALGLTDDCERLTREQAHRIHFPPVRWEWLNARRTLDEIVPMPSGVGLVVRSVEADRPSWELVSLPLDGGATARIPLPVAPINEITHLKADVKGSRLLILVQAYVPDPTKPISMPGRLVLAELGP